ncbi:hypothetical protein AAC899_11400 [Acinetobacter soli]|uniref:hypothetical protein n=1 Tax=Acinetobacter soli TaxID=487316 RepID=UPI0031BB8464
MIEKIKSDYVLVPTELSHEAALKRASEQYEECSDNFKNLHRDCGESECNRLKIRWIESRALQLQDQYRAMIKVVGRAE